MSFQINRKQDVRRVRACTHNLADIPGGVSIDPSNLVPGRPLLEGSLLSVPNSGFAYVLKSAPIYEAPSEASNTIKVLKTHHFLPGEAITFVQGLKAVRITKIDKDNPEYDIIHTDSNIARARTSDGFQIFQAKAAEESSSYAVIPNAVLGDNYMVGDGPVHVTAVTIGQFRTQFNPTLHLPGNLRLMLPSIHFI